MGAAAVAVRHVPEPSESGTFPAVVAEQKPTTLANALASAGVSQAAVADATGISQQRVAQWLCPRNDASPSLRHIERMPRSVRRAIGQALVDGAEPVVVPLPATMWQRAMLGIIGRIAAMTAQVEAAREGGDIKTLAGLMREVRAAQDELARFEAGVRAVMGGAR